MSDLSRRPLGVAIVGGGFMAGVHARAVRAAGAALVGVVSSSVEHSAAAATALGAARSYSSLDELLADAAAQVVHVCTPNVLHLPQALAAIRAGKHVVCEKPLATGVAEAETLVTEAARARVSGTVPFVYRFHPMVREARARVLAGEVGQILTLQGSYLQDWLLSADDDNWRVDPDHGGRSRAFADIGSHLVDLIEFVTNDRVTRLAATWRTFFAHRVVHRRIQTEDAVAVVVQTSGGAIGTLLVSQAAPGRKNRLHLEIAGALESIGFDQENPESLWLGRRVGSQVIVRAPEQLHPDAARLSVLPAGHSQGYQDAFNAFVADSYAAIGGANPEGLPRLSDGLRAVRITDAVIAAAESGAWTSVPE
jgi:predicted dehydrogenase